MGRKLHYVWKSKGPPGKTAFGWVALHGTILTMDNLWWQKVIVFNACPMYLGAEETMDHLLLKCKFSQEIWKSSLRDVNCSWVLEAWKWPWDLQGERMEDYVEIILCGYYLGYLEGKEFKMCLCGDRWLPFILIGSCLFFLVLVPYSRFWGLWCLFVYLGLVRIYLSYW